MEPKSLVSFFGAVEVGLSRLVEVVGGVGRAALIIPERRGKGAMCELLRTRSLMSSSYSPLFALLEGYPTGIQW